MQEQIILKPNGDVVLHLPGKDYKPFRTIGSIVDTIFYTFRSSQKNQKYNFGNSVGFCYRLICDYRHLINAICVNHDGYNLWCTPKSVFKYGTFKKYSKNNLELQIHLSLDRFKDSLKEAEKEYFELISSEKQIVKNAPIIEEKKEDDKDQLLLFAS